ncbi:MAG: 3-phosphoshikimate 1-carboxyvinyltransferase [Oscillospiraceae bacterium]|nr:3-phosphoshikimate 1-carboxyvinyltransferase [Oscillospiraceae bacterium]MDD4413113.1 3-phosphoshikimate 1-carboxyvinyltransferase [Oscillospiraceae bacterium]
MSDIRLSRSIISGHATPPPSKSIAHRAIICASLAGGGSIDGVIQSDDMRATLGAVEAIGVKAAVDGECVIIEKSAAGPNEHPIIDCIESGSTLRFLIPVFAALGIECTFIGRGRLPKRPLGVYARCLPEHGVSLSNVSGLPLTISGRLGAGRYELPGDISSQFISGLMFALPLCKGDSDIVLTTPIESASYIDLTIDALYKTGIIIQRVDNGWHIKGGQTYRPFEYKVEGDWSQAAFLLVMGALGGDIAVDGVNMQSLQGDRIILEVMKSFGADVQIVDNGVICRRGDLRGAEIDASQIPDLVPILAVLGGLADGETIISGASRLRLKESDRLEAVSHCLKLLGGHAEQTGDGLKIRGVDRFFGGVALPSFNDHRIVMSMAAAALGCDNPIIIEDAECVAKSWPDFFDIYKKCGGVADVVRNR